MLHPKKRSGEIALFFQVVNHHSEVDSFCPPVCSGSPSNPSPWGFLGSKLVDPHLSKNSPKNPLILDTRPGKRLQFAT